MVGKILNRPSIGKKSVIGIDETNYEPMARRSVLRAGAAERRSEAQQE
jgi:hypothetical protein